jgi:hypothetical protein
VVPVVAGQPEPVTVPAVVPVVADLAGQEPVPRLGAVHPPPVAPEVARLEAPDFAVPALEVPALEAAEVAEPAALVTVDVTGAVACDTVDAAGATA